MSSENATAIIAEFAGKHVSRNFSSGFVILSYVVSYVGAWTTLELINRRTAGRGLYNWFLLIGSSISMGGISIWCMHYIGNRAIVIENGEPYLQIVYNPGFTAVSFFVPIAVLLAAFLAVGSNEQVKIFRVVLGGSLAGMAICGMHYIGQTGISNYACDYEVGNVIGSVVIAIVASITALSVFFGLRASWTNSWWKRAMTAIILAGAVSGMHWLASVGTQYTLKNVDPSQYENLSNNSTVIVVIVLSISSCVILLFLTLLAQRRRSRSANRAQQVVLAAVVFDKDGRLMVTPEGNLPSQKITNSYVERSFEDVFEISHPAFLWIFRTTRNWSSVSNLLPAMRSHLNHVVTTNGSRPNTKSAELALTNDDGEPIDNYSVIFRELFCVAADELAHQMNESVENIGVLFDDILSTGLKRTAKRRPAKSTPSSSVDIERTSTPVPILGRGQLLFLVRRANRREAEHLQAAGYRFASTQNVVDIVARSMQVNVDELSPRITRMREYANETPLLEPGLHVGCFAVRASVRGGGSGFDILVPKGQRNQIPTMQMPLETLDSWQSEYLLPMNGWSTLQILRHLKNRSTNHNLSKKEQMFTQQLFDTIEALKEEINDAFFLDATLSAKVESVPCRGLGEDSQLGVAKLITFIIVVPIHTRAPGTKLEFVPFNFFRMQQYCFPNSVHHPAFARGVHREFAPILNAPRVNQSTKDLKSPISSTFGNSVNRKSVSTIDIRHDLEHGFPTLVNRHPPSLKTSRSLLKIFKRSSSRSPDPNSSHDARNTSLKQIHSDTDSEKGLVETQVFGGIMVSQEISVDIREDTAGEEGDAHEMHELGSSEAADRGAGKKPNVQERIMKVGTVGVATKEAEEPDTYIDRLFATCIQNR